MAHTSHGAKELSVHNTNVTLLIYSILWKLTCASCVCMYPCFISLHYLDYACAHVQNILTHFDFVEPCIVDIDD